MIVFVGLQDLNRIPLERDPGLTIAQSDVVLGLIRWPRNMGWIRWLSSGRWLRPASAG